jgi:hypothetical protein
LVRTTARRPVSTSALAPDGVAIAAHERPISGQAPPYGVIGVLSQSDSGTREPLARSGATPRTTGGVDDAPAPQSNSSRPPPTSAKRHPSGIENVRDGPWSSRTCTTPPVSRAA